MDKDETIRYLVARWINIAERDLLTAQQGLHTPEIITETVCYHLQQAVEKYLKAFLVRHQIEFSKTHNIMLLLNLCATVDAAFAVGLADADTLTDYAVQIRYPDDWYVPSIEEARQALALVLKVREFVQVRLEAEYRTHLGKL